MDSPGSMKKLLASGEADSTGERKLTDFRQPSDKRAPCCTCTSLAVTVPRSYAAPILFLSSFLLRFAAFDLSSKVFTRLSKYIDSRIHRYSSIEQAASKWQSTVSKRSILSARSFKWYRREIILKRIYFRIRSQFFCFV